MTFIHVSLFGALSTTILLSPAHAQETQIQKQPNIVFILADDLGWGDLSVNGQEKFKTPNIDSIAKNGVNFKKFYSNQAVCAPSRCSILTGKHQGHAAIRGNGEIMPEGQTPLPATETTFASLLKNNGYATACIGKWGLGRQGSVGDPNRHGFDLFYGTNCQRQAHSYYPTYIWRNDKKVNLQGNELSNGTQYAPDLYEKQALAFISNNKDTPFFLFYTTPIPHAALQVTKPYLDKWVGKFNEPIKPAAYGHASTNTPRAAFVGMVNHLDDSVGKMVDELKKNGQFDNTIFIFASDNGPSSEGGHAPDFFKSAPPKTTGLKTQLTEGGVRVPFFISWKNHIKPATSEAIYAFEDVFPTLMDATNTSYTCKVDGVSMMPYLTQHSTKIDRDVIYWEFPQFDGQVAVRYKNFKAVAKNIKKLDAVDLKLYDLKTDPLEQNDISAQNPNIMKQINKIVLENHKKSEIETFAFPQLDRYCADLEKTSSQKSPEPVVK